jgi:hypothetical protein
VADPSSSKPRRPNRYAGILAAIFAAHHRPGVAAFEFRREELETTAAAVGVKLPKNLGDLLYSFRFRTAMPDAVVRTAPAGQEWVMELAGRAVYRMALRPISRIVPDPNYQRIKVPDATPELVAAHATTDEQALLAKVRYNRLIDLFLRVTAYSLQSHLRTSVPGVGQIETDEVYVAVNNHGQQFAIPVQAKGGADQIGVVQIAQDLALCRKAFPRLTPRPVAVQFVRDAGDEVIVMFELSEADGHVRVVDQKHYRLVPANAITAADLASAASRG